MIDNSIIENCRNGNTQEFRKLVEESSPFAFSVAFRMLGDEALAADIAQETMISVWKSIGKVRSSGSFKTWLYRIVINKCYDELRRKKSNPEIFADDSLWQKISDGISHNPGLELENAEIARIIVSLTSGLSPRQKAVFVLADLEDMTNNEISQITGLSLTRVKANLYYARKRIGEMIERFL